MLSWACDDAAFRMVGQASAYVKAGILCGGGSRACAVRDCGRMHYQQVS